MKRLPFTGRVMLLGLFTAQIIATMQVYLSNRALYRNISAIRDAGYLIVPNETILPSLLELKTAFFGGIFFTLTTGAGLILIAIASAWLWERLFFRKKFFLLLLIGIWTLALAAANYRGFLPLVTAYVLFIPAFSFLTTLRWIAREKHERQKLGEIGPLIPLLLLTAIWASQMGSDLFLDIRDNILLSNPVGKKVNTFYYDYTLYPAEVFKAERFKLLRTCHLEGIDSSKGIGHLIERKLRYNDYLPLEGGDSVDLTIRRDEEKLFLEHDGKIIIETTAAEFSSKMPLLLKEFSAKSDRYRYFRNFTFSAILVGFPVTLYILVYCLFRFAFSFFMGLSASSIISSLLCFVVGIALLLPFQTGRGETIGVEQLAEAMQSERWQVRVSALKVIREKGLEIGDFPIYKEMLKSPSVPERYWLATVLKKSRAPETYGDLRGMLDDPHPNVRCKVVEALGKRGKRDIIGEIIDRLNTSDHWYFQWYAYRALRSLGWKQKKST